MRGHVNVLSVCVCDPAVSTNETKFKIRSKRVMWGHVTHFWNFGTPVIYREWLKIKLTKKCTVSGSRTNVLSLCEARRLVQSATPDTVEQCRPGIDHKIDTKLPLKAKQRKAKEAFRQGCRPYPPCPPTYIQ